MEWGLLAEYGWVLLVLIGLEGILAADNALVLAIMVKHLPEEERKKALFYGCLEHLFYVWALYLLFLFSSMYGKCKRSVQHICYLSR